MKLGDQQAENVIKVWNTYLENGDKYTYPVTGFSHKVMDQRRVEVIPQLKALLDKFINSSLTVEEFKTRVGEINKTNPLWGFSGTNGLTFFNLLVQASTSARLQGELNNLIKRNAADTREHRFCDQ